MLFWCKIALPSDHLQNICCSGSVYIDGLSNTTRNSNQRDWNMFPFILAVRVTRTASSFACLGWSMIAKQTPSSGRWHWSCPCHDQQTQVWHWPNKQHIKIHVVYQIVCCCTNSALPRLSMSPLKIFRSCPSNLDVNNFCFRRVHPTLVVKCDGWGNPKSMFAKETKTRVAKNCLNQHSLSMFVRVSNLSIRMRQGTRNGPPMRTGKATEHCFGPFCALIVLF